MDNSVRKQCTVQPVANCNFDLDLDVENECPIQERCLPQCSLGNYVPDPISEIIVHKKPKPPVSIPPLFPCMAEIAEFAKETKGYMEIDPNSKELSGLQGS